MTTEWHPDLKMRVASVIVGRRAIPVQVAAFRKTPIFRSQNGWEHTFLRLLVHTPAGDRPDGGPAVRPWLSSGLGVPASAGAEAVVRRSPGRRGTHEGRLFHPGQAVDLRQDKAVRVRVLGVWAPGQEEPWWLATDLPDPLADLVALYDRRMGLGIPRAAASAKSRTPQYLARFALLLWTAVGQAVAQATPSVRLPCKQKGPCLSLLRVGIGPAESG
jgi:hypothetical protein